MRKSRQWRGLVLVILGASFWGIGGTVSQRLFQEQGILVDWLVTVRLLPVRALYYYCYFHGCSATERRSLKFGRIKKV